MVHGERLLLVEDDPATRELLSLLLAGEGWRVDAVDSGEDALDRATAPTPPDAVLCDLRLPGTCGTALATALRHRLGATCVLLAMTASVRENDSEGYDGLLRKPFPAAAVEAAWRQALQRQDAVAPLVDPGCPEGDKAALDLTTVEQLRRGMGDDRMRGFYSFALGDAGDRLDRMDKSVATGDEATYRQQAHALKGSSGMMGARRMGQLAGSAETEGLNVHSIEKVARLRAATEAIRLMLEALFPV